MSTTSVEHTPNIHQSHGQQTTSFVHTVETCSCQTPYVKPQSVTCGKFGGLNVLLNKALYHLFVRPAYTCGSQFFRPPYSSKKCNAFIQPACVIFFLCMFLALPRYVSVIKFLEADPIKPVSNCVVLPSTIIPSHSSVLRVSPVAPSDHVCRVVATVRVPLANGVNSLRSMMRLNSIPPALKRETLMTSLVCSLLAYAVVGVRLV